MSLVSFRCPHCRAPLFRDGNRSFCENRHSFDHARQGYLHLLVGKGGVSHGDNAEMVEARTRFLDSGHYGFLREAAQELCAPLLTENKAYLDAGCGEGYYAEAILKGVPESVSAFGIDISKYALRHAHRRVSRMALAVASLYELPLFDQSFDLVSLFFSPLAEEELSRVLKVGGHLLLAIPGRRHLFGLKQVLYDTPYENEVKDFALSGFSLERQLSLTRTVLLRSKDEILSLFQMTPYAYRTSLAGRERLLRAESLETELSFELLLYRRL